VLTEVQKGLKEFQVQVSKVQGIIVQASQSQASMVPMTSSNAQSVLTLELCIIHLLDGSLQLNNAEGREGAQQLKNMSINLMALPLQTLHELHQGLVDEIKVREKQAHMEIKDAHITS